MAQLLEREQALAELQGRLAEASRGRGGTVVVTGEPGMGKTSLLERFTDAAAGARVLWGGCEPLSTPRPLGPLHDFAAALDPALPGLLSGPGDRAALFARVLDELVHSPQAVVLVLEDVHWADAATLDLIRFLGRRIHRIRGLMVLSCRDDELSWSRLRPAVAELAPEHVQRLQLQPLSDAAVQAMAAALQASADGIHALTGGNPFFVSELLRHGARAEAVPATVRDAVLSRADRLPGASRRLLELAALFPRGMALELMQTLRRPSPQQLDRCIAGGLLMLDGSQLRFRHELARVAIESAIPPATSASLHREILGCLARRAEGSVPLAQMAHHALLAADAQAVLRWAPAAAAEAALRGARREALAHCRAALRFASNLPALRHAELLKDLASHCFELGELPESIDAYRQAIELHRRAGSVAGQVQCLSALAMPLVRSLRNAEADQASRAALELAGTLADDPVRAEAYATQSYLRMLNRDCREAIDAGERAIALARTDDTALLARAHMTVGSAMFFLDYGQGCARVERSLQIARGLSDGGVAVADAYLMLGTASGELFQFETAQRYLREGIAFAAARDLDRVSNYMEAWQSLCDLYLGRWDAAGARAARLIAADQRGSTNRVMALLALGRLRTRRGDPQAGELLDEALELAMRSATLQRLGPVCAARAEAAWLAGDPIAVTREASRAFSLALEKSHPWFAGELALWLWRAGVIDRPPAGCATPYALQIAGQWQAAADAWAAIGCPYEQASCLADGDEPAQRKALALLAGLGARPLAERLRERMRAAGACGLPRGPHSVTRSNPAGLTRRELEVLRLLSAGMRNMEIATQLTRSVRTVDHHVEAVCRKLGCASRTEAVQAGRRLGLLQPEK